jgi:hypothetical protein
MDQIGIDVVLDKLNDTFDIETSALKSFGIKFLSDKDGQIISREMKIRKRTKGPRQETTGQDQRGKGRYNLQANGLIAVVDVDANMPKSITVAMIHRFRDHKSDKWTKVFH